MSGEQAVSPESDVPPFSWLGCPYPDELCGAEASFVGDEIQQWSDEVAGMLVCANGHRWRVAKVPDG
jgi:hypothetical protein